MRLTGSALCAALALAACSQAEEPADPAASESPSSTTPADEPSDATPATQAASGPLAPRDECTSVEGLGELQTKLKKAVAARDADALTLTSGKCQASFANDGRIFVWKCFNVVSNLRLLRRLFYTHLICIVRAFAKSDISTYRVVQ